MIREAALAIKELYFDQCLSFDIEG